MFISLTFAIYKLNFKNMKFCAYNTIRRCFSFQTSTKIKICIVGSGPAGFYSAQHLLKQISSVEVDIYEKLPVPFGLVRFGVAPDHPEVKNVINTFTKTAQNQNVRFVGNVSLGCNISLCELRQAYHVVLLTYGAEENRKLNIPGENLTNVIPARKLVGWYNGVPSDQNLKVDVGEPSVAIFGQGNVAIDVARILLTPVDILKKTDITQHSLEVLATSKIKEVMLIGRRGPLQAAFTIKELREMLKLQNCRTCWNPDDFVDVSSHLPNLSRPRKRLTELMLKSLGEQTHSNDASVFRPMFLRSPLEILGTNRVEKVNLCVNKLVGSDLLKQQASMTDKTATINCGLVVTSIGYKSISVDPDIPFNEKIGVAQNVSGKISDGLYTTGWLGTGPTGVILTTMGNAFGTAELIASELRGKDLANKPGYELIGKLLQERSVQAVSWNDWLRIDEYEKSEGKKIGKPREKIVDVKKMLEIASA